MKKSDGTTHGVGCWAWHRGHYECALAEIARLQAATGVLAGAARGHKQGPRCDGLNCKGHPTNCYGHPYDCGCTAVEKPALCAHDDSRPGSTMAFACFDGDDGYIVKCRVCEIEQRRPVETSDGLFFILSLKHSKRSDEYLTLWRPDDAGYTLYLPAAGKYTRQQVESRIDHYSNGRETVAVPCSVVERYGVLAGPEYDCPGPVVPNDGATWTALIEHRAAVSERESQ